MIRVLHIVTYMGRGGLETMLMNYYRHIDREKIQFDFLVHRDFEADYDQEILELGGKIYRISRLVPWSRSYRAELKAFFREHPEYRIVHVHQDCLSSVALQCAKDCGIPVRIAHSHNSNQDRNLKYLVKRCYMKKIPDYATDLFACSHLAGEWMFGGKPFEIVCNAIDAEKYLYNSEIAWKVRNELGINNDYVIGHVGRFNPQKNHTFLIDVFNECVKMNAHTKLILVGAGERIKQIQDKVNSLGIQDKVIFTGVRTDVNEILQAMDVFLFPSLYEGLGISAIEAQASGLPCIISDVIPDDCIVTKGLVHKVSLNDSPVQWANIIMKLKGIPRTERIGEIRNAGYDILRATKKLEGFYLRKYVESRADE